MGDSGLPGTIQDQVSDAFLAYTGARGADLWLMLDDNAYYSGTDAEYGAGVFVPYAVQLRQWVLWPTRGNHDVLQTGANNDYYDFFTLPALAEAGGVASGTEAFYSYDYANIHFVCPDSEGSSRLPGGAMLTWLKADLAATDQDWVIAYWHQPPYSKGSHDSDAGYEFQMREMRENVAAGARLAGRGPRAHRSQPFVRALVPAPVALRALEHARGLDEGGRRGRPARRRRALRQAGAAPGAIPGRRVRGRGQLIAHERRNAEPSGDGVVAERGRVTCARRERRGPRPALPRRLRRRHRLVRDPEGCACGRGTPSRIGARIRASLRRPLPSRGAVEVAYRLPAPGGVRVAIYDAEGRRIATVAAGQEPAGERRARWDGRDASGVRNAGVYFAVVEFSGERRAARVVLTP